MYSSPTARSYPPGAWCGAAASWPRRWRPIAASPRATADASTFSPTSTLAGSPGVYFVGDIANIPGEDGKPLPQLGSVALQSGIWAADNILATFEGKQPTEFHYKDKGIMAMIGRGAAIAEVGKHHHEVHGELAHMAWLGVHASLMTGTRAKIEAFVDWAWDGFTKTGGPHVLDRGDAAKIDWDDDPVATSAGTRSSAG